METRKYEGSWAKAVAELKIEQKDYNVAKMFALKAKKLYPGLDDISEMLLVVEVYLSAEKMIIEEADWYRVLDVHPLAVEDTIKKQYKKLSLLLHPDKNRASGAAGAFHLISHAYRLLTDRQRREAFDQRCRFMAFPLKDPILYGSPLASCRPNQHNVPPYSGGQSVPPGPIDQKVPSPPDQRTQPKVQVHVGGSSAAPPPTFWTICSSCDIPFEYDRKYCGCKIRCQECKSPFLAIDIGMPKISGSKPIPWKRKSQSANFPGQGNVAASASMNSDNREKVGSAVPAEHVNLKRSRTTAHGSSGRKRGTNKVKLV